MKHARTVLAFFLAVISITRAGQPNVELIRTPNHGIQPQAAADSSGVVHLIYYRGDAQAGDIFYTRLAPDQSEFSPAIQVNAQIGSAVAAGTIRGAQLAVGKKGRVHVVWNGSAKTSGGNFEKAPLLYARLNDEGTAFEPERNLITYATGLDGGSSVAADPNGNVYVTWHAHAPGAPPGELGRAIFLARSTDDGKTFRREERISPTSAGVCACCGMRSLADPTGSVYVLYRAAFDNMNRDQVLLASRDGNKFDLVHSHKWEIAACPMSSASLASTMSETLAAWETSGNVYLASINPKSFKVSQPIAPPGQANRKHPAVTSNSAGHTLFVWTEGTGWQKGGAVAWQLYGPQFEQLTHGRSDGVPVWSLATTAVRPNGNFIIIY